MEAGTGRWHIVAQRIQGYIDEHSLPSIVSAAIIYNQPDLLQLQSHSVSRLRTMVAFCLPSKSVTVLEYAGGNEGRAAAATASSSSARCIWEGFGGRAFCAPQWLRMFRSGSAAPRGRVTARRHARTTLRRMSSPSNIPAFRNEPSPAYEPGSSARAALAQVRTQPVSPSPHAARRRLRS